jgi:hypothetical protein
VNAGTITWSGGTCYLINGANFTNLAGALFESQSDDAILPFATGTNSFYNFGTFRKSAGAGATMVNAYFQNNGTVEGHSGTLLFSANTYTNPAGTIAVSGGNVQFASDLNLPGGLVTGSGTVQAPNIINSAVVSPGATNAILNFAGNYTQLLGGSMQFDIGGTSPGVNQSQFNVTGSASLSGLVVLRFSPGYVPAVNSSNLVVTAGSLSGQFSFHNYFYLLGQNKRVVPVYSPTNVVLTTISAADPTNPALSAAVQGQTFALAWPSEFAGYYLVTKTNLNEPNWTSVPGVTNFYSETPITSPHKFFRLFPAP